jgi:hypothetical protein
MSLARLDQARRAAAPSAPLAAAELSNQLRDISSATVRAYLSLSAEQQEDAARSLTAEQRAILEESTEAAFSLRGSDRQQALKLWLAIQTARLAPDGDEPARPKQGLLQRLTCGAPQATPRPEYQQAIDAHLRIIGNRDRLPGFVVEGAMTSLVDRHLRVPKRIDARLAGEIARHGVLLVARHAAIPLRSATAAVTAHAQAAREQQDIALQTEPLSAEIAAWQRAGKLTSMGLADAFDRHEQAMPLARLLSRLREQTSRQGEAALQVRGMEVARVLQAIAGDEPFFNHCAILATTGLASCRDNVDVGFANILLAVETRELLDGVRKGQIGQKALDDWGTSMYRLSVLETEVHRFLEKEGKRADLPPEQRRRVLDEPVETMLHAKVMLKKALSLPASVPDRMAYERTSVLTDSALRRLEDAVKKSEKAAAGKTEFLLGNDAWREAMKALHPDAFKAVDRIMDKHRFTKTPLPPQETVFAAERDQYNAAADEYNRKLKNEEDLVMCRLAGLELPSQRSGQRRNGRGGSAPSAASRG